MALPPLATTAAIASQIPWRKVYDTLRNNSDVVEGVWDKTKALLGRGENPPAPPEPVADPADTTTAATAALRSEITALRSQLQRQEHTQLEQARLLALLGEQTQTLSAQLQATATRAARAYWVGAGGLAVGLGSALAAAIALLRL